MDIEEMIATSRLTGSFPLPTDAPFTRAQAVAEGVTRYQLTRLTKEGLLRRPIKAVYLATELGDSLILRAQCLKLVTPEDAVIVDRHAGWLHGAPMVLAPNEHLHLRPVSMFLPSGRGRLRNKLSDSGERNLTKSDIVEVYGLRVSTPIRTAWDLGRVRFPDQAIAGLSSMLRLEAFSKDELLAGIERFRGMRWVTILRGTAPLADARFESPGEAVLFLRCTENGLFGMVPQVEVWRGAVFIARLDLADVILMFAVEYDGAEWHSSPEQQALDRNRREAASDEGYLIKAFEGHHVFGRTRECDAMLREGAREARLRRGSRVVW